MSNYHHHKIEKLDDFRHPPTIVNPKRTLRRHLTGYTEGAGKYEAPSRNRQTGPIVMGGARYQTYQQVKPGGYYGTPVIVRQRGCVQRCCACLGSVLCCMCLCDMLT